MSVSNIMNLAGKVEQFGGTVAAWVQLILAIKTFYDYEFLLKMDGAGSCTAIPPANLVCVGEPCCIDYMDSMKLPSDAVIIEKNYWLSCASNDVCTMPTDVNAADYFVCKDVDNKVVASVKSPVAGMDERMAVSGNIAFQVGVWLAVVGYIISESYLMAVEWKFLENPTKDMDFGSMLWTAFTNVLKWFWIFPTILITNSLPHNNCMHFSSIGGIDTGLMVKLTFAWIAVFGFVIGCIFVVAQSKDDKEKAQYTQAGLMGMAFLVFTSTALGLYSQILSVVDTVQSVTFGVLIAQVVSVVGLLQQKCFPTAEDAGM